MDKEFKLSRVSGTPVSNEEILSDLKRVSKILNETRMTQKNYEQFGQFNCSTIIRRFGYGIRLCRW